MKKYLYLFLFLVPLVTMAQNIDRSKAPSPGKAPLIQVGDPVKFTLANGLQVFVVKNTKLPQVSATLALDYDGFTEGDKAGVAQMAGQLLKRGTATKSKAQLDEAIEFYKVQNGHYPESLEILQKSLPENSMVFLHDATQVNTDGKLYYYKLINESSYHIRSYGRDGLINTTDDILPSPIKNVGLVADYQVSNGL